MTDVIAVVEGPTEETFVRDVLKPHLSGGGIYLKSRLIPTSGSGSGGALSPQRVLLYLRNTLRERNDTYVTTFFDLYGLDSKFPGVKQTAALSNPLARATAIEAQLAKEVIELAGCRADRFHPHIQPYEFEALLFSAPESLIAVEPDWRPRLESLREVRSAVVSPEHINNSKATCPSGRLESLLIPQYRKVLHGPQAAKRAGLSQIRAECLHFGQWLTWLEALKPL